MKISYNWLKQYLNIDLRPEEVAQLLTSSGLEVESLEPFESVKGGLAGIVVGEVKTCEKHPDADKLSCTTVDIGNGQILPIVCGAANVAAGQHVLVATIGTTLYAGEENFVIKKSKIRGVLSEGMICAEDELGLGTSHNGVMVLEGPVSAGQPATDCFPVEHDVVFEIGLTPNRSDAISHFGVARDLYALLKHQAITGAFQQELTLQKPGVEEFSVDSKDLAVGVTVQDVQACPRYSGVTIRNITVAESPLWLKNRLQAIGLRPINNIVDITNYVLHETGQPLHAFDADKITGGQIIVRKPEQGTRFVTLDEVERTLSGDDLMICNAQAGMCLGGVFGGLHAGVTDATRNLFLESACFDPATIRRTARFHGLNTDSSFRFERGTDISNVVYALKRAAMLICEVSGGKVSSDIIDVYPEEAKPAEIRVRYDYVERLTGQQIPAHQIGNILRSLDFEVLDEDDTSMRVRVPFNRVDVTREVDIVEEILRIFGYNNIPVSLSVKSTLSHAPALDKEKLQHIVAGHLSGNGFMEIWCNSLTNGAYTEKSGAFNANENVKIPKASSQDLNVMRQTLLFGGLESVAYNVNRKSQDLRFYEFGNIYKYHPGGTGNQHFSRYSEYQHLGLLVTGQTLKENWKSAPEPHDLFSLKSAVTDVIRKCGLKESELRAEETRNGAFSYGLSIRCADQLIAEMGCVHKSILNLFSLKNEVFFAEVHWSALLACAANTQVQYAPVHRYPDVRRDLALLLDKNVTFEQVRKVAFESEKKLLQQVNLFDIYQGEKIAPEKKSYAVSFVLHDEEKTLTDKVVDKTMQKLLAAFAEKLGAALR